MLSVVLGYPRRVEVWDSPSGPCTVLQSRNLPRLDKRNKWLQRIRETPYGRPLVHESFVDSLLTITFIRLWSSRVSLYFGVRGIWCFTPSWFFVFRGSVDLFTIYVPCVPLSGQDWTDVTWRRLYRCPIGFLPYKNNNRILPNDYYITIN